MSSSAVMRRRKWEPVLDPSELENQPVGGKSKTIPNPNSRELPEVYLSTPRIAVFHVLSTISRWPSSSSSTKPSGAISFIITLLFSSCF